MRVPRIQVWLPSQVPLCHVTIQNIIASQTPLGDKKDHYDELTVWVLGMLKEHTDKITNAELEKRSKQMGKMELGDNNDDDEFREDIFEAGVFKKVKV
jgi:hypothetical protein